MKTIRSISEVRAALAQSLAVATTAQRRFAIEDDARCMQLLAEDGVAIVPAAEIDRAGFKAALAPLIARESARFGPDVIAAL